MQNIFLKKIDFTPLLRWPKKRNYIDIDIFFTGYKIGRSSNRTPLLFNALRLHFRPKKGKLPTDAYMTPI